MSSIQESHLHFAWYIALQTPICYSFYQDGPHELGTTKILIHKSINSIQSKKRIRPSYNGIMLLLQHADGWNLYSHHLQGDCVFSEHLHPPAWQMSLRYHFNSDFSSRLNFKIKTNLILNAPFIAPVSSRPYQENL